MKLLIISDSHGSKRFATGISKHIKQKGPFDYLIHCGDGLTDLDMMDVPCPVISVRGNCDLFATAPEKTVLKTDACTIFITHGHLFSVKRTLSQLSSAAKTAQCAIALYGHTHQQGMNFIDSVYYINPGALNNGQFAELTFNQENKPIPVFFNLTD